jgi:hypothetical protein
VHLGTALGTYPQPVIGDKHEHFCTTIFTAKNHKYISNHASMLLNYMNAFFTKKHPSPFLKCAVTTRRRYIFGQIYSQTCESDNCPWSNCYAFYRATLKSSFVERRIADVFINEFCRTPLSGHFCKWALHRTLRSGSHVIS